MGDVGITFDGDLSALNRSISDLAKTGERAGRAINKPMEKLLEGDKRVERSLGNMANGFARAQSSAEGLVAVLDNLENTFNTPLWVGAAAAIGVALNQALEGAARGANAFSASVEKMLSKSSFDATVEDVERMREQLRGLEASAGEAGLFERWIFGGQKEEQLESVRQAIEQAAGFAQKAREAAMTETLGDARMRGRAVRATEEGKTGDAQWIEQRLRQAQELRKAEDELQAVIVKGTKEQIAIQREIFDEVQRRHSSENRALDQEISKARYKKELEADMQELSRRHSYELMGFYSERERAEIKIQQSQERQAVLAANRGANEKQISDEKLEQSKLIFEIAEMEKESASNISAAAEKQDEKNKKLKDELDTQRQLRDIEFDRGQMRTSDPFARAQNALARARSESAITAGRLDSTDVDKARAELDVLRAQQSLLEAAASVGPGIQVLAGAGNSDMTALRRSSTRSALNDAARANQSQARMALAQAQRSRDPYGVANRQRSDRMRRAAEIQGLQAQDVIADTLDASEAARMRGLSDTDFRAEMDQRRLEKEQAAREKEKRDQGAAGIAERGKGEEVPTAAEAGPPPAETKQDPSTAMVGHLRNIDKNMASVEKKLPQRALI